MKADTPGKRVYLVRLARGDGVKNPERLEDFASALSALSGKRYDGSMISRMENGGRTVSIRESELIASLDPLRRSPAWVAFGDEKAPAETGAEDVTEGAVPLTPAQKARAVEKAAEIARSRRAAASVQPKRPRSNGGR